MRLVRNFRVALLAAVVACGSTDPQPVPTPEPYVGTWKSRGDDRLVLTEDGRFQWTKDGWTNTGLVTGWTDAGFEISAFPENELHLVQVKPHDEAGYTWMTVDEVRYWRSTRTANIGKLVPKGQADEVAPPPTEAPTPTPTEPTPTEPAGAPTP